MRFELDDVLTGEILFYMENQDGPFLLDTQDREIINAHEKKEAGANEEDRFIPLPEWSPQDGFRLREHFTATVKNPVVRQELSDALNKGKGVFRSFKNTLEQYPQFEKLWFKYKNIKMKIEITAWYNVHREIWGLEPIGSESEDISFLILEDFVIREGKASDAENAEGLHKLCAEEMNEMFVSLFIEQTKRFPFPGDLCLIAEAQDGDFSGYIFAVKEKPSLLRICALEVKPEYRGMGLGKTLLSQLLEKVDKQKYRVIIDLPAGMEHFARSLHLENFKPCMQRFIISI